MDAAGVPARTSATAAADAEVSSPEVVACFPLPPSDDRGTARPVVGEKVHVLGSFSLTSAFEQEFDDMALRQLSAAAGRVELDGFDEAAWDESQARLQRFNRDGRAPLEHQLEWVKRNRHLVSHETGSPHASAVGHPLHRPGKCHMYQFFMRRSLLEGLLRLRPLPEARSTWRMVAAAHGNMVVCADASERDLPAAAHDKWPLFAGRRLMEKVTRGGSNELGGHMYTVYRVGSPGARPYEIILAGELDCVEGAADFRDPAKRVAVKLVKCDSADPGALRRHKAIEAWAKSVACAADTILLGLRDTEPWARVQRTTRAALVRQHRLEDHARWASGLLDALLPWVASQLRERRCLEFLFVAGAGGCPPEIRALEAPPEAGAWLASLLDTFQPLSPAPAVFDPMAHKQGSDAQSSSGGTASTVASSADLGAKTRLCVHNFLGRGCANARCSFAHAVDELALPRDVREALSQAPRRAAFRSARRLFQEGAAARARLGRARQARDALTANVTALLGFDLDDIEEKLRQTELLISSESHARGKEEELIRLLERLRSLKRDLRHLLQQLSQGPGSSPLTEENVRKLPQGSLGHMDRPDLSESSGEERDEEDNPAQPGGGVCAHGSAFGIEPIEEASEESGDETPPSSRAWEVNSGADTVSTSADLEHDRAEWCVLSSPQVRCIAQGLEAIALPSGSALLLAKPETFRTHQLRIEERDRTSRWGRRLSPTPVNWRPAGPMVTASPEGIVFQSIVWLLLDAHVGADKVMRQQAAGHPWEALEATRIGQYLCVGLDRFCNLLAGRSDESPYEQIEFHCYWQPDPHKKLLQVIACHEHCQMCQEKLKRTMKRFADDNYDRAKTPAVLSLKHKQKVDIAVRDGASSELVTSRTMSMDFEKMPLEDFFDLASNGHVPPKVSISSHGEDGEDGDRREITFPEGRNPISIQQHTEPATFRLSQDTVASVRVMVRGKEFEKKSKDLAWPVGEDLTLFALLNQLWTNSLDVGDPGFRRQWQVKECEVPKSTMATLEPAPGSWRTHLEDDSGGIKREVAELLKSRLGRDIMVKVDSLHPGTRATPRRATAKPQALAQRPPRQRWGAGARPAHPSRAPGASPAPSPRAGTEVADALPPPEQQGGMATVPEESRLPWADVSDN